MSSSKDGKPSQPSQPETPGEIQISLNIIPAAKLHLEFLKQVSKFPGLAEGPLLTQAIHRYVNLWLQLAAKHDTEILPAPLDIQWAWHCHMLCPVMYKKDCMSIVGKVVDFKLFTSQERKKLYPTTQRYWAEAYPNHPLGR